MKKYIKSSFGYYDDWIDPPDPDYEAYDNEIEIILEKEPLRVYDISKYGPEFEFTEFSAQDYYDPDYDVEIVDGEKIEEEVWEQVSKIVPAELGEYKVSGQVYLTYTLYVPIDNKYHRPQDEGYEELEEAEGEFNKTYSKNLQIERAE